MTDADSIAAHDWEITQTGAYGFPSDWPSRTRPEVAKAGVVNVGSAVECLMRACRRLVDNDRDDAMDDISLALSYLGANRQAEIVSEMSMKASENGDH